MDHCSVVTAGGRMESSASLQRTSTRADREKERVDGIGKLAAIGSFDFRQASKNLLPETFRELAAGRVKLLAYLGRDGEACTVSE